MQRDHAGGRGRAAARAHRRGFRRPPNRCLSTGGSAPSKRTVGRATLHEHDALVGKVAGELGALADEFAPRAIERQQAFGDIAAAHAMDDAQRLDAAGLRSG